MSAGGTAKPRVEKQSIRWIVTAGSDVGMHPKFLTVLAEQTDILLLHSFSLKDFWVVWMTEAAQRPVHSVSAAWLNCGSLG